MMGGRYMTCTIASSGEEVLLSGKEQQILKQRLAMLLLALYKQGYQDFYVNCNYGIPLWAAELICKMKEQLPIRLHIAAPHEEQCSHWLEAHRNRYMAVHEKADTVMFVSHPDVSDSSQQADEYMVERSNLVIVYETKGHTLYIEEYAADLGVPVHHL